MPKKTFNFKGWKKSVWFFQALEVYAATAGKTDLSVPNIGKPKDHSTGFGVDCF